MRQMINNKDSKNIEKLENPILEGVIWKQLLVFFFPILFGSLFQQLYNTADMIIVGRFVGKEALSAVGGGPSAIIQLLIGLFTGLSSGATVIISQYYGANKPEKVRYAVHTAIAFSLICGVVMMIGGYIFTPHMLAGMNTPAEVSELATVYMRIYFCGMIGNLLYNMGSGILRAVGDSKRPLYFLIVGCVVNIVLDILLIAVCNLGVVGAGIATILSQLISAILVIWVLIKKQDMHQLIVKKIKIDKRMFSRIIQIGFPAGMQSIMYSGSNILIQTSINGLGTDYSAAWASHSKVDALFWMTMGAFGISITTFIGQNYGAGKIERMKKGILHCWFISILVCIIMSSISFFFGKYCLQLFTTDANVLAIGTQLIRYFAPVYILYVTIEILSGAMRGVGDCWKPMMICCFGVCGIRVLWILLAVPLKPDVFTIAFSYPLTWTVTTIGMLVYFLKSSRFKKEIFS